MRIVESPLFGTPMMQARNSATMGQQTVIEEDKDQIAMACDSSSSCVSLSMYAYLKTTATMKPNRAANTGSLFTRRSAASDLAALRNAPGLSC
jgi:hypothetical protein